MCEGKEETPVHVIRDDDINPAILNKETLYLEYDKIEEEKSKLFQRKRKKLIRKTVAELQQKVNLKEPQATLYLCSIIGVLKMGQALRERDDQKAMKAKMWEKVRFKSRKREPRRLSKTWE
ncbi:hypothetical protein TNCT_511011 [Trichonephila clavata]|uniref:Uncharacterized protein n=1 Tax=Trichonephila clavata TaxID=2740835 RepID=A0A8X6LB14_TRICU|nr:hypothetical protein TNCT_511011 [Trichonephila clavata]